MKLLLTSAGFTNKSIVDAFLKLSKKTFKELNLVFIPTAANVEDGNKDWLVEDLTNCNKLGFNSVDIVDISAMPQNIWLPRIKKADVLLFGGGNTYYLMSWLKKSGLEKILPKLLKTRIYVGISAGSMVATKNLRMSTSQKLYSEKVFPLKDDSGLGFVNFHIRPHFNSKFFPNLITKHIQESVKEITEPVYAIDDNTAIMVEDGKVEVVSEGKWQKFN
jgi:dipeptidase E